MINHILKKNRAKTKLSFCSFWLILTFALLFPLSVFADDIADDTTASDDTQVYHIYEGIDLFSTLNIQYEKPRIVIKSVYPQLQSDEDNDGINGFNQTVNDILQQEIATYKKNVLQNRDEQKKLERSVVKNDLYIDYDTSTITAKNDRIISVRFTIQGIITGLKQAYHYHRVLNYNLNNNRQIELGDLFQQNADYLTVLSQYTKDYLQKRFSDQGLINKGTAPSADNFKNWNIKPNGLLITFDAYQVAPYAQTILVPFTALKEILSPESPITDCIKHRKKCARNNILTGGFIDEAGNFTLSPQKNKLAINETMSPSGKKLGN